MRCKFGAPACSVRLSRIALWRPASAGPRLWRPALAGPRMAHALPRRTHAHELSSPPSDVSLHRHLSLFPDFLHRGPRQALHRLRRRRLGNHAVSARSPRRGVCNYRVPPDAGPRAHAGRRARGQFGPEKFIARAKQFSGYEFGKRKDGRLWQKYGYEHVLRDEESTGEIAAYILENPLRAKLAETVEEYPYFFSSVYCREELVEFVFGRYSARSG